VSSVKCFAIWHDTGKPAQSTVSEGMVYIRYQTVLYLKTTFI